MAEAETVAGPVIATLKERADGETRVALSPETAKKLTALGATVRVESGAGLKAAITDEAYREAGAEVGDLAATVANADWVFGVQAPEVTLMTGAKQGAKVAAVFDPFEGSICGPAVRLRGRRPAPTCCRLWRT